MKHIKIAIVEDTESDAEKLKSYINAYKGKNTDFSYSLNLFKGYDEFLAFFLNQTFDLIFLDINLGSKNGMNLAFEIRKKDKTALIIFETELEKYAAKGYEVDAIDFMVKPVTYPAFELRMNKAINILNRFHDEDILLKTSESFVKIPVNDIIYVEVSSHYLQYHTHDEVIKTKGNLSQAEKQLGQFGFLKCNNYLLVNASHITSIEKFECVLGETKVPISHPRKKVFLQDFMNYLLSKGVAR